MAMFRSLPLLSSPHAKVHIILILLYAGLCKTTAAVAETFQQEESNNKQHEQRTATIHNPYTSSLSTSATVQNQVDYFYNHHGDDALSSSAATPPAPKCWRSAMHVLLWQDSDSSNRKNGPHQQDAATICQSLPDSHQKLLALEIARCHMADLGRNLFSTPTQHVNQETATGEATTTTKEANGGGAAAGHDVEPSNCHEPLTNVDDMYLCLKYLTDSGTNAYTQYVSYVQLLCTRLTQEVFLSHQQDVQQEMARRYQDVASQSVSQMETIHGLAKLQTDQFHALATQLPEQMREKLTFEIQERLSVSVNEHLDEHLGTRLKVQLSNLSHVMQEQATNQALALQRAWEQVAIRERQEQTAWWQNSAREIQEQRDAMKRAWERMDALLLGQTTAGIMSDNSGRIMAGLEFVLTTLTWGYSWVAFLLYFVTMLNMIWLFTRPRICHGFRAHLFALVLLEAAAELLLLFLVEHNVVLTEWERVGHVQELRRWTIFLECTIFVLGLLLSMFFGSFTTTPPLQPPPPPPLTGPTMRVDTTPTTRESFRPVPGPRGTTSNTMMGMNHPQQQQQQHRLLYASSVSQQPFGPTAQVTPQQHHPIEQETTSMYYSPIAWSSGGHEIFGRGDHHGTVASDYHNHHHQYQSPSSFVSLHGNQQQQQQRLHQHQQIPPPPAHPVMYHHYYSSPTSLPLHGNIPTRSNLGTTTTTNNADGVVPPFLSHYRHDAFATMGNSLRNNAPSIAAAAFSRFSAHDQAAHEQQQHQHQYHQSSSSSPFVSLVRDNNNNSHNSVSVSPKSNVAAAAHGSSSSAMQDDDDVDDDDDDEDEDDVFMDALCEIPKDSNEFQVTANVASAAAAASTTPITTATTTTTTAIMPTTQDCLTHENAMARKKLSRKRRANNHHQEDDDDYEKSDAAESSPSPRKKLAKIGGDIVVGH